MTVRARWLLLAGLAGAVIGVLRSQHTLAWLSLTVLVWMLAEWLMFCWRLWAEIPGLCIQRSVGGRTGPNGVLFAGRPVVVEVRITAKRLWGCGPMLVVRDCVPEYFAVPPGQAERPLLTRIHECTYRYEAQVLGAGQAVLPGFRITIQDAQGFFSVQKFVACEQRFRILPAYASAGDTQPVVKRINSLPQHGIHRLQRAGLGSELLELREYVPGDPPKSIAWKVSARRGTLMTRQYESEVPVRVCLFLDGSISTRVGGFGCRLLDQMTFVAGSVARSAISVGDPVGAVLFDETGSRRIAPASGDRGFYRLLEALSDFSINPAPPQERLTPQLLNAALRLCGERWPELLDPRVNIVPFTFFPLSPGQRRLRYQKSRVAAVLAEIHQLQPMQILELVHDDQLMAASLQRFLTEAGVAWMDPLLQTRSRGFHDGMATMELLSDAIAKSVMTARDNEVYVIMANLLECATNISYLLPALRMAIARHHRVVVVCPTPMFRRPVRNAPFPEDPTAEQLLSRAEDLRTEELAGRLRRALRRIGAAFTLSGEEQAIRLIMNETQMARSGRIAASGARG
ncbi:MAG: DUF58 domain-containing protein [Planctomycetaceae bacterium]